MPKFKQNNIPAPSKDFVTDEEVREIIAAALANWTGITRFRTVESVVTVIADFSNAQHNHTNTSGGGQLTDAALSAVVTVPKGGTGVNTITSGGILKGAGAGAITTVVPQAGVKTCFVANTNGGLATTQITFTDGILTAGL